MSIELVMHNGIVCPEVYCDECGERIESGGVYTWTPMFEEGERREPHFAHKSRCDRALERKLGGRTHWGDLADLLVFLTRSLDMEWGDEAAAKSAAFAAGEWP